MGDEDKQLKVGVLHLFTYNQQFYKFVLKFILSSFMGK